MEWFGREVELMADWATGGTDALGVVLIADAGRTQPALDAVGAVGGQLLATVAWADAAAALDRIGPARPVVLLETIGVDAAVLDRALPRLDAEAAALDLPLIATLDERGIDPASAMLATATVHLLCDPSPAERVTALAIAARQAGAPLLADVREGEAERLRRLNEEVARIAAVLAQLATREDPSRGATPSDVFDRRAGYDPGQAPDDAAPDAQPVRHAIRARRMRDMFFGEGMFEDPAWDMLLDLFAAELEGTRVSVSSLCIAAAVAPTTALRWIGRLTDAGLFERRPDPADRRRAFMALSPKGSAAMRGYWGAVRRAGLAIA